MKTVVLYSFIAIFAGCAAGYLLRRYAGYVVAMIALAGCLMAIVGLLMLGRSAQGIDGVGYMIFAVLVFMPLCVGGLIGAFWAWRSEGQS